LKLGRRYLLLLLTKMPTVSWSKTENQKEWDDFASKSGASIFHTWGWRKVLTSSFGRPLYLACRDKRGEVVGILPLIYRGWGRHFPWWSLESLPLSEAGGPILDPRLPWLEMLRPLIKDVRQSLSIPVGSMQLRMYDQKMARCLVTLGYYFRAQHGSFILDLHRKSPATIWEGLIKHDRQAVKYYEGLGSTFDFATREEDYADYLGLHEETVFRGGGRPLVSPELLQSMRLNLGPNLRIAMVRIEDRPFGGVTMICDPRNQIVHLLAVGYAPIRRIHSPIVYLNWKALNWAVDNGYRYLNFGGTTVNPKNPVHRLKQRFGGDFAKRFDFVLPISTSLMGLERILAIGLSPFPRVRLLLSR